MVATETETHTVSKLVVCILMEIFLVVSSTFITVVFKQLFYSDIKGMLSDFLSGFGI